MGRNIADVQPEELEQLYIKHKLIPDASHIDIIDGRCCGLGVLVKDHGTMSGTIPCTMLPDYKGDLYSFAFGFDLGFRDHLEAARLKVSNAVNQAAEWNAGVKCGMKMKELVLAGRFDAPDQSEP